MSFIKNSIFGTFRDPWLGQLELLMFTFLLPDFKVQIFLGKELHSSLNVYNLSENMIFAMGNQFPEWAPYIKVNLSIFF